MSRVAYVNGQYVPHSRAAVHIEDRGFQFADGVYEVCEIWNGTVVDMEPHLDRLDRSLRELSIKSPMSRAAFIRVMRETIEKNRVKNGLIYIQINRGVARRDHYFPSANVAPSVILTSRSVDPVKKAAAGAAGIRVVTTPENRWDRVDIKTVGLLPNVLAKQKAKDAGAKEAWFVDNEGFVTEGGSTNVWLVLPGKVLVTRPADHGILRGITRSTVIKLAEAKGFRVEERRFTVDEAKQALEAFVTSASGPIMPVIQIDDTKVGDGNVGETAKFLRKSFYETAQLTKLEVAGTMPSRC
ncbi:D-amino-acid transaminase [Rhodobacteraceae bacterium RKSG542]|uniref:D-amino-acid transaminase n=1 Tax=Pseudovibrio flavus TaxID=2529854 RepID=UPI0012BBC3B9|nr:D-amino-acid transaminase [Pseudovibrio flavus]MTI16105.1 D-amino-acid transaminase [Pseudovibrio flavus]